MGLCFAFSAGQCYIVDCPDIFYTLRVTRIKKHCEVKFPACNMSSDGEEKCPETLADALETISGSLSVSFAFHDKQLYAYQSSRHDKVQGYGRHRTPSRFL